MNPYFPPSVTIPLDATKIIQQLKKKLDLEENADEPHVGNMGQV